MSDLLIFGVGLVFGVPLGMAIAALLVMAKDGDERAN